MSTLDEKRRAALAYLGKKWILHPSNAPERRQPQMTMVDVWREMRQRRDLSEKGKLGK